MSEPRNIQSHSLSCLQCRTTPDVHCDGLLPCGSCHTLNQKCEIPDEEGGFRRVWVPESQEKIVDEYSELMLDGSTARCHRCVILKGPRPATTLDGHCNGLFPCQACSEAFTAGDESVVCEYHLGNGVKIVTNVKEYIEAKEEMHGLQQVLSPSQEIPDNEPKSMDDSAVTAVAQGDNGMSEREAGLQELSNEPSVDLRLLLHYQRTRQREIEKQWAAYDPPPDNVPEFRLNND